MWNDDGFDDFCSICRERFDIEFNSFATSILTRYTAHCHCTAERAAKEEIKAQGGYTSAYRPPTLGDLLKAPERLKNPIPRMPRKVINGKKI